MVRGEYIVRDSYVYVLYVYNIYIYIYIVYSLFSVSRSFFETNTFALFFPFALFLFARIKFRSIPFRDCNGIMCADRNLRNR